MLNEGNVEPTSMAAEDRTPQDLHSLVTPITESPPTTHLPHSWGSTPSIVGKGGNHGTTSAAPSRQPSHQALSPIFNHSSSIFSPDERAQDTPAQAARGRPTPRWPPTLVAPSSGPSVVVPDAVGTMPSATRAQATPLTTDPVFLRAEKDADDLTAGKRSSRRAVARGLSATNTHINRLFAPFPSREPSFTPTTGFKYTRSIATETASLSMHLYRRGLMDGRHSDIKVKAFNKTYHLHRIILDRAPFFSSAMSEPWYEAASGTITLHPEEIDPNITQTTFELALKRLYGIDCAYEEELEATGLFATGCWLEMEDLVRASVDALLRCMQPQGLSSIMHLVTANYYGKSGDRILMSAKAMLCRDGWEMPLQYWDGISSQTIRDIVSSDGFYVLGEWERWGLAKRLLDRRLKRTARALGLWPFNVDAIPWCLKQQAYRPTIEQQENALRAGEMTENDSTPATTPMATPSNKAIGNILDHLSDIYSHPYVVPLLQLIDDGIHYMHLDFEQLQHLRSCRDVLGMVLLPEKVITGALWANMELRQRIMNAPRRDPVLGLCEEVDGGDDAESFNEFSREHDMVADQNEPTYNADEKRYWIPTQDCSLVIGGNGELLRKANSTSNHRAVHSSTNQTPNRTESGSQVNADMDAADKQSLSARHAYTTLPPFRFAAEFPHPRMLTERKRISSKTYFYAGSFWNLYIQKVKSSSKEPQLGVYLHRAKERDLEGLGPDVLASGSVDERIGYLEREMQANAERWARIQRTYRGSPPERVQDVDSGSGENSSGQVSNPNVRKPMPAPNAGLSSFMTSNKRRTAARHSIVGANVGGIAGTGATALDDDSSDSCSSDDEDSSPRETGRQAHTWYKRPNVPAMSPYIDVRPTVTSYFKIYSPSKGGRMLSLYESAPDYFDFSQSWGWKSSTLMVDDDEEETRADVIRGINSLGLNAYPGYDPPSGDAGLVTSLDDGDAGLPMNATPSFQGNMAGSKDHEDVFLGTVPNSSGSVFQHQQAQMQQPHRPKGTGRLRFMVVLGVV